jgi:hypothetical protein
MYSDMISENIHNIIDSFLHYEDYSIDYYDDTIMCLAHLYKLLFRLDSGTDRCDLYICKLFAKNAIDQALFKKHNCECESYDYCELCDKFDKKISDFENDIIRDN